MAKKTKPPAMVAHLKDAYLNKSMIDVPSTYSSLTVTIWFI